jgi:hypothetical protein
MRWLPICSTAVVCVALATPARAERPVDAAAAEQLFERGRTAVEHGDYETACNAFAESQRLDPGAGTLLNWANCEATLGRVASAWYHFNEAAALLSPRDQRVRFVRSKLRDLAPRLPRVTVRLAESVPPGARVFRAGTELGSASLGLALPIDPGEVELVVSCPGYADGRRLVHIDQGEQVDVELETRPNLASTALPHRALTEAAPSSAARSLGWSFLALGSLGVGIGLASGAVVADRRSTVDQHCESDRCDATGLRAAQSGQRWLVVNTIAWGAGVAALATGGALVVWSQPTRSASVVTGPNSAMLSLQGTY